MTLILYNVFIGDFRGTLYVYFTPIPLRGSIVSSYAFAEPLGSKICKGAEIGRTPERRFKCCSRTDIDSYMSLWFWSIRCPKLSTIYYNRYVVKLCWWVRLRGSQNHNQLTFIRCPDGPTETSFALLFHILAASPFQVSLFIYFR